MLTHFRLHSELKDSELRIQSLAKDPSEYNAVVTHQLNSVASMTTMLQGEALKRMVAAAAASINNTVDIEMMANHLLLEIEVGAVEFLRHC